MVTGSGKKQNRQTKSLVLRSMELWARGRPWTPSGVYAAHWATLKWAKCDTDPNLLECSQRSLSVKIMLPEKKFILIPKSGRNWAFDTNRHAFTLPEGWLTSPSVIAWPAGSSEWHFWLNSSSFVSPNVLHILLLFSSSLECTYMLFYSLTSPRPSIFKASILSLNYAVSPWFSEPILMYITCSPAAFTSQALGLLKTNKQNTWTGGVALWLNILIYSLFL